jgi:hypothetical protein
MSRIIRPGITNAGQVSLDTTNFNKNLSSMDNTVQKALETLDELVAGGGSSSAGSVTVSTTNFAGNLSSAENTVQKALDKIDDLVLGGSAANVSLVTSGFNGRLSATENTVQKAFDKIDDLAATDIPVNSAAYAGNLTTTHNTVQKIADAVNGLQISGVDDWTASTIYRIGDNVTFMSVMFKCSTAHTSAASFDPSKWRPLTGQALVLQYSGIALFDCAYYTGTAWSKGAASAASTLPTHMVIYVSGGYGIAVEAGQYTVTGHGYAVGSYYVSDSGSLVTTPSSSYEVHAMDVISANDIRVRTSLPAIQYAAPPSDQSGAYNYRYSFSNSSMTTPQTLTIELPDDPSVNFIDMDIWIRPVASMVMPAVSNFINTTPTGATISVGGAAYYSPLAFFPNGIESANSIGISHVLNSGTANTAGTTVNSTGSASNCIPMYPMINTSSTLYATSQIRMTMAINHGGNLSALVTSYRSYNAGGMVGCISYVGSAITVTSLVVRIAANICGAVRMRCY